MIGMMEGRREERGESCLVEIELKCECVCVCEIEMLPPPPVVQRGIKLCRDEKSAVKCFNSSTQRGSLDSCKLLSGVA